MRIFPRPAIGVLRVEAKSSPNVDTDNLSRWGG